MKHEAQTGPGPLPPVILQPLESTAAVQGAPSAIPGYLALSTASENVEDPWPNGLKSRVGDQQSACRSTLELLERIGSELAERQGDPELVIAVHGFSNTLEAAEGWYRDIHRQVNGLADLQGRNLVFIGYRWPSENPFDRLMLRLRQAFAALPFLPRGIVVSALIVAIVMTVLVLLGQGGTSAVLALILALPLAAMVWLER